MVNVWGEVVGILFAGDGRVDYQANIIPAKDLLDVMDSVK
jgi:hypothetical protein